MKKLVICGCADERFEAIWPFGHPFAVTICVPAPGLEKAGLGACPKRQLQKKPHLCPRKNSRITSTSESATPLSLLHPSWFQHQRDLPQDLIFPSRRVALSTSLVCTGLDKQLLADIKRGEEGGRGGKIDTITTGIRTFPHNL